MPTREWFARWVPFCLGASVMGVAWFSQLPNPPGPIPEPTRKVIESTFDSQSAGQIVGRVVWSGKVPDVESEPTLLPEAATYKAGSVPNPFQPIIDPESHGVAEILVYLEGIDPRHSKPWDIPAVEVDHVDHQIVIVRGQQRGKVGVVRAGDEIVVRSSQAVLHMLRFRGAEFFTLPLPQQGSVAKKRLEKPGIVELTSGAGHFWTAADLLVTEHPYATITNSRGEFTLTGVPAGKYELVCRLRSRKEIDRENDPETGLIVRKRYAPPLLFRQQVTLTPGSQVTIDFEVQE